MPLRVPAVTVLLLSGCHLALPLSGGARDGAAPEGSARDLTADTPGDGPRSDGALPAWGCPSAPALDADTLALFTFDGVTDLTGKHTVTLHGSAALQVDPDCGGVARFPGLGDSYGEIPDHADWQLAEGSVDLWFRLDQPSANEEADILSRDANNQALPGHLTLIRAGDYLIARLQDDAKGQFHRCHKLTLDGAWHHVGINLGPPDLQLFVDGEEVAKIGTPIDIPRYDVNVDCDASTTLGIAGNDNPWVVGASARTSTEGQATPVGLPSRVAVDNLRISNRRRDFDAAARCRARYGLAFGFVLCESDATSCSFNAEITGRDCNIICAQFGGVCLGAWDNSNNTGEECLKAQSTPVPCDDVKETNICVCSQ